ncbi:flagellar hook-associated protein FlgL [Virgibacillus soli]|uniref:Flagellar hook-associated protein FlgL n=1 Tax=Paracerasibacillus soli TaxID=480284 RepID=A0ABU5CRC6_9BACI|nr:flagellar hook-associated protein FlgL [Virgibacillus soli]MDY0408917.1 flagellar hook-associated protein FlgL [Virgibacillus soli]
MRVTQNMLSNQMLRNLSNNYKNLDKYMEQINTGKKITRPSDDPVVAMQGMTYRSEVGRIEQYQRNVGEVQNWMDNADTALDKATQALQRVRELAIKANNGPNGEDELNSIKEEVEQLKSHLIDIANTNVNGKYIFNGTNINTPPYSADGTSNFNNEDVTIEIGNGTAIEVNVKPEDAFEVTIPGEDGTDSTINVMDVLDNFIAALGNEDSDKTIDDSIAELDLSINKVINARADLGARMNRVDLIEDRLSQQEIVATKMMSDNEDVDYEEVITNLITQESILRASLSAGSRIIQPSLLDFLR